MLVSHRQPAPHPATWCEPDGERILTTRDCYPPPDAARAPRRGRLGRHRRRVRPHVHVARLQGHADREPPAGAAAARTPRWPPRSRTDFLDRGVALLKGARADGRRARRRRCRRAVRRRASGRRGSHVLLAIGSIPNSRRPRARRPPASRSTRAATSRSTTTASRTSAHIYAAGDVSGKLPLSSVAAMQGRKVAEHVMGLHTREHRHLDYDKAAQAIFTEPEIAEVGLAEAEAFAVGRKIRVTKVPFSAGAKALINDDPRGFVKILSDPATGVVLGGVDRRPPRRRAHLGDRAGRHRQPQGQRHRREPAGAPLAVGGPRRSRRVGRDALHRRWATRVSRSREVAHRSWTGRSRPTR